MSKELCKLCDLTVAGVQHHDYKDGLSAIGNNKLDLVAEPTNEHDPSAVKIMHKGLLVGYVSRGGLQQILSRFLLAGYTAVAKLKSPDMTNPVISVWIPNTQLS